MTIVKPDSPPPAYSAIPSIASPALSANQSASSSYSQPSLVPAPSGPPFAIHQHNPHTYGPTPILQQQAALLPYYDPRSPYSIEQAVSRARWRFVGAILWAIGIWIAFGLVTGGIVIDIRRL
ncbi:hypothetical protein DFH11DRAFT_692710 [Phellopilus nigrolimitatus]|nr:hypothetical protein DFH11DRAFT_692710 [Phellopilus nigrolimitatus]